MDKTVPEWCKARHLSRSTYHKLKNLGLGPKELKFPARELNALRQRLMLSGKREWRSSQRARPRGSKQSAGASSPLSPARSQRNHLGM